MTGTTSLRRRLSVLFVVTGILTAVVVAATLVSLMRLDRATHDRVDVYGPALLDVETLAGSFSDQETGLRGFLAGGQEPFLQPYRAGRAAEMTTMRHIRRLLHARPDLVRRVDDVQAAANEWRASVARPAIARVRTNGVTPQSVADVEAGTAEFDRIRGALVQLRRPVLHERNASSAALSRSQRRLDVILGGALAGLVVLAAATFWALRRWVTQPLSRLGEQVDEVERGDLDRPVAMPDAPEEIAVLAAQVDGMRARVVRQAGDAEEARARAAAATALVEEQAEDLRRSNTELEQFAYVASHDLQEPLRKVASFCQLIERRYKGQLDERGEQYIEFAVDGAKRMQQLINDLLMFSRVGRHSAGTAPVDLEAAFAQAMRQLEAAIEESAAVVTHESLPTVEGDHSLLVQLLQNLLGNGLKFRGDQPPRVHLTASRSADDPTFWEFTCSDNGIGIEEQYSDKIFVIFQRLHGRDAYSGTGIGLAMCKKIVEYHGGRLWLDAAPRDTPGAVFRWTLPERQGVTDAAERDRPPLAEAPTEDNEDDEDKERSPDDAAVRG